MFRQSHAELRTVGQTAAVPYGDHPLLIIEVKGLCIFNPALPSGGVADMPQGDMTGKAVHYIVCKNLADQSHPFMAGDPLPVADSDPRALLAAVLKSIKPIVSQSCHILPRSINTEQPAGLLRLVIRQQ